MASGANGGGLRSLDINPAGDLVLTWENWRAARPTASVWPYGAPAESWSYPRLVYTDLQKLCARECRGPTLGRLGRLRR